MFSGNNSVRLCFIKNVFQTMSLPMLFDVLNSRPVLNKVILLEK